MAHRRTPVRLASLLTAALALASCTGAGPGPDPDGSGAPTTPGPTATATTSPPATGCAAPAADPSAGLSEQGTELISYSPLARPARGERVEDPDFPGTRLVRVTDALVDFSARVAIPAYPTTQAWNCDETRFVLYVTQGEGDSSTGWAMFDGTGYGFLGFLDINPADIEQFYWSHTDPSRLVFIDNRSEGTRTIMQMVSLDVETGATTVLHDFAAGVAARGWPDGGPVRAGYPFAPGGDLELWGLGAGGIPNVNGQLGLNVFGFDLTTSEVTRYPDLDVAQGRGTTPFPLKSGAGWAWPDWDNHTTVVLDRDGRIVRTVPFDAIEHLDTAIGPDGHDLLVGVQFDGPSGSGNLMVADLTTGEVTTVIGEDEGDGYPRTGTFLSAAAWKVPGWVAMGVTGSPYGSTSVTTPASQQQSAPRTYLDQEVTVTDLATGRTFRVAHHRSTGSHSNASQNNYWAQPNVSPSPSGTRILVQSDWGNGDPSRPVVDPAAVVDTYVIELPAFDAG